MTRGLLGKAMRAAALAGAVAGLVVAGQPAVAAPAINAVDFTGIVALSN